VLIELLVGVVGGLSSLALFLAFAYTEAFRLTLYGLVLLIGILVGLEIPLLMRILKDRFSSRTSSPTCSRSTTSAPSSPRCSFRCCWCRAWGSCARRLLFGVINVLVGLWSTWLFRRELPRRGWLQVAGLARAAVLGGAVEGAGHHHAGRRRACTPIPSSSRRTRAISASCSPAGRMTCGCTSTGTCSSPRATSTAITRRWCTPGCAAVRARGRVLVLGGGDGLAVREILRYPDVQR
jgi:spermidine synthase